MKILKRDKSVEDFDIGKITRVVQAAGLSKEQADTLTESILKWTRALNSDVIIAESLRDEVCTQIKKFNENAASMFKWYEDNKYNK